jgi:hypothetical protein
LVEAGERAEFAEAVRQAEKEARQAQGHPADAALGRLAQAAVSRAALREVLLSRGLLRLL